MSIPFKSRNLQEIFTKLDQMLSKSDSYELHDTLSQLRSTYTTMLQYMVKGVDDPNAGKIYLDMLRQCYKTGFRALRMTHIQQQPSDKYVQFYKSSYSGPSFQTLLSNLETSRIGLDSVKSNPNERESIQNHDIQECSQQHQTNMTNLFNQVWTSDNWHSQDYETSQELLSSTVLTSYEKSFFVSAVLFSLLETFDERKLMCLFDGYSSEDAMTRMRSAVSIVLVLRQYDGCIDLFPKVSSRLSLLMDDHHFIDNIYTILMQLQYSMLTDKISAKMQNDIIPTLLNSGKFHRTNYGIEEIDDYLTQNGENPEWHKGSRDDVAQEKIQEIAELQMEGADVQMSTFIHMKNSSFFHYPCNWLLPFSTDHPDIINIKSRLGKESEITKTFMGLLNTAPFCDSDRYSFSFMIERLGSVGQEMVDKNLRGQMSDNEMKEQLKELSATRPKEVEYSRFFIHDLYRFFAAYPYRHQFSNPFSKDLPPFTPLSCTVMAPLLNDHGHLLALGEFFMRKELYTDAVQLFYALNPQEIEDHDSIWQKIGFCQQKSGDYEGALSSYTTAYSLNPESRLTLKHLASVSYHEGKYSDAEVYYDLLLNEDEDNLQYLSRKADCQIQDSRYSDAVPLLYKLNYLDERSAEVKEKLAYCLLMTEKRDKARELYEELLSEDPVNAQYHLDLGNIHYLSGDMETAYTLYSTAYNEMEGNADRQKQFKRMFVESAKRLKPLGIDIHKYQMMYDAVVIMNSRS